MDGGTVLLLDAQDGERLGPPIEVGKHEINPVSFSPDGRLLAANSGDQTAAVWDLASRGRLETTFPAAQGGAAAHFAPDGDLVIAYSGEAVKWPMDPRKWRRFACQVAGRDLTPCRMERRPAGPRIPSRLPVARPSPQVLAADRSGPRVGTAVGTNRVASWLLVSAHVPSEWAAVQRIPDEDRDCGPLGRPPTEPEVSGSNPDRRAHRRGSTESNLEAIGAPRHRWVGAGWGRRPPPRRTPG
jgi:hypothetical protein